MLDPRRVIHQSYWSAGSDGSGAAMMTVTISLRIDRGQRRRMKRLLQKTRSRIEALRARILLLLHGGHEPSEVAALAGCARALPCTAPSSASRISAKTGSSTAAHTARRRRSPLMSRSGSSATSTPRRRTSAGSARPGRSSSSRPKLVHRRQAHGAREAHVGGATARAVAGPRAADEPVKRLGESGESYDGNSAAGPSSRPPRGAGRRSRARGLAVDPPRPVGFTERTSDRSRGSPGSRSAGRARRCRRARGPMRAASASARPPRARWARARRRRSCRRTSS